MPGLHVGQVADPAHQQLILPNGYSDDPNYLFLIPISISFSSRCPFTNKFCHNGWIWDSDKCECVIDAQHSNRREGKDGMTLLHTLSKLFVSHSGLLLTFLHRESESFYSTSLDRLRLWCGNLPENKHTYVLPLISRFVFFFFFSWMFYSLYISNLSRTKESIYKILWSRHLVQIFISHVP